MAAPLLILPAALAALLGGGQLAPWAAGAAVAVADLDAVVVDIGRLCAAADPLLDALAARPGRSRAFFTLTRSADRVCAAAAAGPGVAADIGLVIEALRALRAAKTALGAAAAPARIAIPAPRRTGR